MIGEISDEDRSLLRAFEPEKRAQIFVKLMARMMETEDDPVVFHRELTAILEHMEPHIQRMEARRKWPR